MQRSSDRILTTHTGSLPRGEPLSSMLLAQEQGKPVDSSQLNEAIEAGYARSQEAGRGRHGHRQ
jgi:5-methyltetrahydropteroyltriglutamate--homocysteine methyltransferase